MLHHHCAVILTDPVPSRGSRAIPVSCCNFSIQFHLNAETHHHSVIEILQIHFHQYKHHLQSLIDYAGSAVVPIPTFCCCTDTSTFTDFPTINNRLAIDNNLIISNSNATSNINGIFTNSDTRSNM